MSRDLRNKYRVSGRYAFFGIVALAFAVHSTIVLAQDPAEPDASRDGSAALGKVERCVVMLRMLQGSNGVEPAGQPAERSAKQLVPALLPDMESQLGPLPFSHFEVLDSAEQEIPLDEQGVFVVADGDKQLHRIAVTPHEHQEDWVKMTVHWDDPNGKSVVSTQLRVINAKCLVLGTDKSGDRSTILSVKVTCP